MLIFQTETKATPISIEFGGTVTRFDGRGVAQGISVNDAFQVILSYDDAAIDAVADQVLGLYSSGAGPDMIFTSGGHQISLSGPMKEWVSKGSFTAQWQGGDARLDTTWSDSFMFGRASLDLRGAGALDSDALPTDFNIDDWTGSKSFFAWGGNGYGQFEITGEITSARRVASTSPVAETLPTGLALAGVTLLLGLVKRRC